MDPIAHTFTGAALAAAGLRRATPLATAALVIGANVPDVDIVASFAGDYAGLAFRRGWTHGVLVLSLLPFLIAGALLAWQRLFQPSGERARAGPLLAVAALAVATHPTLDWLNNYGMRWLMPFDGRWFYGDALFIIDPWVWLALGGVLFLRHSGQRSSAALWGLFWVASTALVVGTDEAPVGTKVLWAVVVAALLVARARRWTPTDGAFAVAAGAVALYMAAMVGASAAARAEVREALAEQGIATVERVMVGPTAGNPFRGTVVAATPDAYHIGEWRWLEEPRLALEPEPLPQRAGSAAAIDAAAATLPARRFLTWSRFPYFEAESKGDGYVVRVRDARYHGTDRLVGPDVRLDRDLRPLP